MALPRNTTCYNESSPPPYQLAANLLLVIGDFSIVQLESYQSLIMFIGDFFLPLTAV